MQVVLLCQNDWANLAHLHAKAFNSVGIKSKAFSKNRHKYKYPDQASPFDRNILRKYITESDVVIFFHSQYIETGVSLKNKIVCVKHTGSKYRQNYKQINKIFNPIVDITFGCSDMLNYGAKNEIWIVSPIDIAIIPPTYRTNFDRVVVGHFPSGEKGFLIIKDALNKLKIKNVYFKYNLNAIPWGDNLNRMKGCDIYIEHMNKTQNGVPLRFFGITALEAAALGKVVCSRVPLFNEYEREIGPCGIINVDNSEELKSKIEELANLKKEEFLLLQRRSIEWVKNFHSFEAVGNRYKSIFLNHKKSVGGN